MAKVQQSHAVKLGILREVIHERQDRGAIEQQTLALTGVGHIAQLVRGDAQLLGKDLAVSACLVEHIHEVRVFKDVLHLTAGKQVFDILGDSCWDLFVIIRQFFICLSGDFSHFQRCVISHPA